MAHLVKNPPAIQKTWVRSLGSEDPLGKGMATHSSILAWRIPWTVYPWGHKESNTTEQISLHFFIEWSGGFPYFLQFKSEFGDKEPR